MTEIRELTAEELLQKFVGTPYSTYTNSDWIKYHNEILNRLRRLTAAPQIQGTFPEKARKLLERFRELDAVRLSPSGNEQEEMDNTLAELLDGKTAAAPSRAQARCPKCGAYVGLYGPPTQIPTAKCHIECSNPDCYFELYPETMSDLIEFFSSPSAPQDSKPSCHICGEGMDKGFICGKCGAHTGVAQAAPAGEAEAALPGQPSLAPESPQPIELLHCECGQTSYITRAACLLLESGSPFQCPKIGCERVLTLKNLTQKVRPSQPSERLYCPECRVPLRDETAYYRCDKCHARYSSSLGRGLYRLPDDRFPLPGLGVEVARHFSGGKGAEQKFQEHTQHVQQFLNDLWAFSIDPLHEGMEGLKVADVCAALLKAAKDNRDSVYESEGLFRTACLWVWKGLDAPGQTLESTMAMMREEHKKDAALSGSAQEPENNSK